MRSSETLVAHDSLGDIPIVPNARRGVLLASPNPKRFRNWARLSGLGGLSGGVKKIHG
jgi:hypothetical protein